MVTEKQRTGTVRIKRAYEEPEAADGYRVLVDRLWPRGVRKDELVIDAWMKEIGPSDELRRWFGHDPARWDEFVASYRDELRLEPAAGFVDDIVEQAKRGPVTLVYGAKDELHNQAVVLRDVIKQRLQQPHAPPRQNSPSGPRLRHERSSSRRTSWAAPPYPHRARKHR
jgi:uncharacterized protein YeaO (DUF488 family)